jgi:hypothetical protein
MSGARAQGWLLALGLLPAAVLLGRLAWDLGGLGPWLAVPIWIFYGSFLVLGSAHALAALRGKEASAPLSTAKRVALGVVIPVSFLASMLDCMGLAFVGCTSICGFLMQIWAPFVGVLAVVHVLTGRRGVLVVMNAAIFLFVVPNCLCSNPINRPWIELLGQSPACYAGSFGVSLVALGALRSGKWTALSIAVTWLATLAMLAFFVGHHFYDYPW